MADDDADDGAEEGSGEAGGGSTLTVVLALVSNVGVGVLKLVAGLLTGSSAMLAEAAHSVADTTTEVLLLTALRRSARPADRFHPFGYGKERFFWALIAAVSVFVTGATFSVYEGVATIVNGEREQTLAWVAYGVLALSAVIEGTSWAQSVRQIRAESRELGLSPLRYLRLSDDPTVKSVFFEDSAALIGLALAALGVGLHQLTGSGLFDGLASLLIGVLLAGVAFVLGRTNRSLLIGRTADPALVHAAFDLLADAPEVDAVVDIQTMVTGTDSVLLCARVDFLDALTAADLERACVRLDDELRDALPDLDEVFIEPVPRSDPDVRAAVLERYGDVLARWQAQRDGRAQGSRANR
ncbi:MAG TPA: cation diffusion facilitator family transporter [Actinomycetospora sp.]|jgi:cation diffusion facilitator family transporter|uniref:cation diffusion facilitator family transporter n=1 Tax=Actinomycetospora sp. TaxID=1872135 RepID=UPI002F3E2987